jgi:hypothetical protein
MIRRVVNVVEAGPAGYGAPAQASLHKMMEECGMETPAGTVATADQHIRLGCVQIASATFDAILLAGRDRPPADEFEAAVSDILRYVTTGKWPHSSK